MSTIYGESPEIQIDNSYAGNGGVALYSVGDGEGGTITGGSGNTPGENETYARIRWAITVDANGTYVSGGITGSTDWMRDVVNSPFADVTDQQLADYAISSGNLNAVFESWNESHNFGEVFTFMIAAWERYPNCVYGMAG